MNKVDFIWSPEAIRERANKLYELALAGKTNFKINEEKIDGLADFVLEVTKENYPTMDIPFHSRWTHFNVGSVDRISTLDKKISDRDKLEIAKTKLDLVVASVLLDAGAGKKWSFKDPVNSVSYDRSEGLAVASYYMFMNGEFSLKKNLCVDVEGLINLTEQNIIDGFQITNDNPLVGTKGRLDLLQRLGQCMKNKPEIFKEGRPGNIIDHLISKHGEKFKASDILRFVLEHWGDIWPGRKSYEGKNLGDVWEHSLLGNQETFDSLIPFHKLSQWLTYSLIEPMLDAGLNIEGVEKLTGLAEYRNGGLLIDYGVLELRDNTLSDLKHRPDSELIIEWRALTVVLLDSIANSIRKKLVLNEKELPLVKILEGGTWWAGRKMAKKLRPGSTPPLTLDSDGTVF
jgi:hypothetical protein